MIQVAPPGLPAMSLHEEATTGRPCGVVETLVRNSPQAAEIAESCGFASGQSATPAGFNGVSKRNIAGYSDKSDMSPLDAQAGLLSHLMDAAALRQQVVTHNLANLNTPGYQRLEATFEDQFQKALSGSGDVSRADGIKPRVMASKDASTRSDGNNVDLDREVGELQRTALMFQTYTKLLEARLGMMRRAIDSR
jgi:flagellar basal-body rod protein FlgB